MPQYTITRIEEEFPLPGPAAFWGAIPSLTLDHYLWLDNGYRPRVEVRLCYGERYLYVLFKSFESKIRAQFSEFQDPVYKDSCVEFFINPFPDKPVGYINVETNAIGAMLTAIGPDRSNRRPILKEELRGFEIVTSVKSPLDGYHGADLWTVEYKLPLRLIQQYYGEKIKSGHLAKGNFYKCGDEADPPHFGAWSPVRVPRPDFHRPEYFGLLIFR
ncbi:MAG: carbohydrate-binding family 9-like protein [Acidobacteriota bacterium]